MTTDALNLVYAYIDEYIQERGYSPTVREIGVGCGIGSTATVFKYLNSLQDRGDIKWEPKKARTISTLVGR